MTTPSERYLPAEMASKKIDLIKEVVSSYYKQPLSDYDSRSRKREVIKLKYLTVYLISDRIKITHENLGKKFGYDHASIIHAIKAYKNYLTFDRELKNEVKELNELIEAKIATKEADNYAPDQVIHPNPVSVESEKQPNPKGMVFFGYTPEEVSEISSQLGLSPVPTDEVFNSGVVIYKKSNNG